MDCRCHWRSLSKAKYQTCYAHLIRNIAHKGSFCEDIKLVYRANDEEAGKAALENFCDE